MLLSYTVFHFLIELFYEVYYDDKWLSCGIITALFIALYYIYRLHNRKYCTLRIFIQDSGFWKNQNFRLPRPN